MRSKNFELLPRVILKYLAHLSIPAAQKKYFSSDICQKVPFRQHRRTVGAKLMSMSAPVLNPLITVDANRRFGKPCVRDTRIAVADVLGWLAAGMSGAEVIADYPTLTHEDVLACLSYAAQREAHTTSLSAAA